MVYLESGERKPTWETVQLLALALEAGFEEFADPAMSLPVLPPPKPRGRPRKAAGVAQHERSADRATSASSGGKRAPRGRGKKGA